MWRRDSTEALQFQEVPFINCFSQYLFYWGYMYTQRKLKMLPDDGTSTSRWIPWLWMPEQSMVGKEAPQTLGDSEHPCLSKAVLCIFSELFPTPSCLPQQLLLTREKSSCVLRKDDIFKVSIHIPAYISIFMIKIISRKMLFEVYGTRIRYHICSSNLFGLSSDIPNSQRK